MTPRATWVQLATGAPAPPTTCWKETDLLVFVGTVPGDVITDGFVCRQDWNKQNFLVTIDPSLRGRSGPVSRQILAKPEAFVRDLAGIDLPVKDEWKAWTGRMRGRAGAVRRAAPGHAGSGAGKDGHPDGEPGAQAAGGRHW